MRVGAYWIVRTTVLDILFIELQYNTKYPQSVTLQFIYECETFSLRDRDLNGKAGLRNHSLFYKRLKIKLKSLIMAQIERWRQA